MTRHLPRRALVALCTLAAVALSGCGPSDGPAHELAKPPETLRVSGSGTCLPLVRILAAAQPAGGAKMVFLPGLHTKGGIRGVAQGSLDIGAISRPLEPDEQSADLRVTWLSSDGIAIAVNESVSRLGVTGLTSQQVRDIYAGNVTDWQQVGAAASMPIVVLDRHEDESAKIVMRTHVFGPAKALTVTPSALALYYETDMAEALQSTKGAIGYLSLGYASSQSLRVSLLALDGVMPSVASISSGRYPVVRPLGMVTRSSAPPAVEAFVRWATGTRARAAMADKGYAPYRD